MMRGKGPRRSWTIVQLVVGLALLGGAALAAVPNPTESSSPQRGDGPVAGFQQTADGPDVEAANLQDSEFRLSIPALSVDTPLVSVDAADDGVLGVPKDPAVVGWWEDGVHPGNDEGTAVLAGHVNTAAAGSGALHELSAIRPGDEVAVSGWEGDVSYQIESVQRYPKDALPASEVFTQNGEHRLAIVSCDDLDERSGEYRSNVIAFASPTDGGSQ